MNQEALKAFKELLRKKSLDGLESFWLELLETETASAAFLDLVDLLLKAEQRELATTLMSVLISHRKEHGDYACALDVLKRQAELNPNDRYLRREMINCYRQIYSTNARLDTYVSKSELGDLRPVAEAVRFLENCIAFDVDGSVYDGEQGLGKVTELDLMVDKIVVDFGHDKPVSYHLSAAFKHLVPLKPDHFLLRKRDEPDKLRELGKREPLELLKIMLKGFDRSLKPREIKEYLGTIVADTEWDGFWNKVSRAAAEDPDITVLTRPERSFQWHGVTDRLGVGSAEPGPQAPAPAEPLPATAAPTTRRKARRSVKAPVVKPEPENEAHQEPAPELAPPPATGEPVLSTETETDADGRIAAGPKESDVTSRSSRDLDSHVPDSELAPPPPSSRTRDEFVAALRGDTSLERWKSLLAEAQKTLSREWPQIFRQAFLDTTDKRIWALIVKQLGGQSATFQELVQETTTYYKKYTPQFLYLQQNAAKFGFSAVPKGLLSRLLDILDSDRHKSFWAEINKWMAENNDLLLRECFKAMTAEEVEAMWLRLSRMRYFEDFRKEEILKVIQSVHTGVGVVEARLEDSIFCTREGIERKQAELRQLVDIEIPKTSEDIGRARSFGDLSENYEYKAAKEKQARLLAKVAQMQRDLSIARAISSDKVDTNQVGIGTKVKVEETPSGETQEFAILGPWDIDPDRGIISYQAPFAQRLMNKRVGDFVPANPTLPSGRGHKIIEITKAL